MQCVMKEETGFSFIIILCPVRARQKGSDDENSRISASLMAVQHAMKFSRNVLLSCIFTCMQNVLGLMIFFLFKNGERQS